jgi:hypothetical protein
MSAELSGSNPKNGGFHDMFGLGALELPLYLNAA